MDIKNNLASIWSRIGGGLIDLILVAVLSAITIFLWGVLTGLSAYDSYAEPINWELRGVIVWIVIDYALTAIFMSDEKQSTLGQRAVGIKTIKNDGGRVDFMAASTRYLASLISSLVLKLGYLIAIFTENNRTLHDFIAGTIVVRKDFLASEDIENFPTSQSTANLQQSEERKEVAAANRTTTIGRLNEPSANKHQTQSMEDAYATAVPTAKKIYSRVKLEARNKIQSASFDEEHLWEQALIEYDSPERNLGKTIRRV